MHSGSLVESDGELEVSFGYRCSLKKGSINASDRCIGTCPESYGENVKIKRRSSSFSCLSGAALSANATLANTSICNGLIGAGILPSLDSPKSFRHVPSSPSFSRLDVLSSSLQSNISSPSSSLSSQNGFLGWDLNTFQSMSAPSRSNGFLNAMEVQVAGGAAGEDRVQAVCSEENGWLFCAIYDGFNGRDAADFLAGTLYENIIFYLDLLDQRGKQQPIIASGISDSDGALQYPLEDTIFGKILPSQENNALELEEDEVYNPSSHRVLDGLQRALSQAESEFLCMVEQEMDDRPDLVSVGSCVLVVLLHDKNLYTLSLGDSRAVLAISEGKIRTLKAVQLTENHSVANETERLQLLKNHPDDPSTIVSGRVKGKLKLTRAFGVGYLKRSDMNDALMGILRVRNLLSPPYITTQPSLHVHKVSNDDQFVIVASDGLFDFFSNEEAVDMVHSYILNCPSGDPAKFLVEKLVAKAAATAGFSMDELMRVPAGRKRKYHDDVTVIVIILGSNQRTTRASTCL